MKKLFFIAFLICFSFYFISCQPSKEEDKNDEKDIQNNQKKQEDKSNTNKSNTNLINDPRSPNPSSELAVLMRDIWEYADTLKTAISTQNSNSLPEYRSRFKEIHKAIPTDQNTKSPTFNAMATLMLQKLENVYQSENKEQSVQVEGFNLFVKSCLQCHQQQCPGPISKISKLIIK